MGVFDESRRSNNDALRKVLAWWSHEYLIKTFICVMNVLTAQAITFCRQTPIGTVCVLDSLTSVAVYYQAMWHFRFA